MLSKLTVHGFKPFRNFVVEFSEFDVFVGRNNMGKSTLVDSLRLIASESNFRLRRDRVDLPRSSVLADAGTAFLVDKQRIQFPTANVHHEYGEKEREQRDDPHRHHELNDERLPSQMPHDRSVQSDAENWGEHEHDQWQGDPRRPTPTEI